MGHAIHFLEQLSRAPTVEADLALNLYHHHDLTEAILREMRLPSEVERVALSLNEQDNGPYLVLTRQGDFVTCLAQGMRFGDLYFVNYERLCVLQKKAEEFLHRRQLAESLTAEDPDSSYNSLLNRMTKQHRNLTREEFLALTSLQPFLQAPLLSSLLRIFETLYDTHKTASIVRQPSKKNYKYLEAYWEIFSAISHLMLLIFLNGRQGLDRYFQLTANSGREDCLLRLGLWQGDLSLLPSVMWAAGRVGKPLFASIKQSFTSEKTGFYEFTGLLLCLLVLALRHSKLRAQISKLIQPSSLLRFPGGRQLERFMEKAPLDYFLCILEEPEKFHQQLVIQGRDSCWNEYHNQKKIASFPFSSPEEIPEDVALADLSRRGGDFLLHPSRLIGMAFFAPWLSRIDAEDLYLPADIAQYMQRPWNPREAFELMKRWKRVQTICTLEKQPSTGRNEPCPCGSGKKYKKCCLAKDKQKKKK